VVAPSIVPEGFGRVPVESQAMGKPVIASDLGGFRETIAHGETGLLVPPGDVSALAQAIDAVFNLSQEERDGLGDAAAARARQLYSKEQMCEATLRVYAELTNAIAASGRTQ
jgi:glycosyltransferase involved in cell wall biosynthesis